MFNEFSRYTPSNHFYEPFAKWVFFLDEYFSLNIPQSIHFFTQLSVEGESLFTRTDEPDMSKIGLLEDTFELTINLPAKTPDVIGDDPEI